MRIKFLDKITGEWAQEWTVAWFFFGVIALALAFWYKTAHTGFDWFYLGVSITGLICVVSLGYRKNLLGNGFGMLATAGEGFSQWHWGASGLMLTAIFNFFTHIFGLLTWSKNTDADGNMIPKTATKYVWIGTAVVIVAGLMIIPMVNEKMVALGLLPERGNQFYYLNVLSFVLSVTAQVTMILRYSFNWWLWIIFNLIAFATNLLSDNYIFAMQMLVYEVNAIVGLYGWYRSEADQKEKAQLTAS